MTPYYSDDAVTIYHGDCREFDHLPGDVLVTDPPYGYAYASGWDGPWQNAPIAGDGDVSVRDAILGDWGARPAICFGHWRGTPPQAHYDATAVLVWDKGLAAGMGDLSVPWKPNWEMIYVFGEGFHGRRDSGVLSGYNVVTWATKGRVHPNEKPIGLLRDLIAKCPPGAIFDPFMGSGTTLRAAKDLGRKAVGIEIEERYCEIAAKRCAQEVLDFEGVA